jgi:hypothetical protein
MTTVLYPVRSERSCVSSEVEERVCGGVQAFDFPFAPSTSSGYTQGERNLLITYSGLHLNEERKRVGRNKRSVSGIDEHAGNGLRPYPGLRLRKRYVSSLK